MGKIQLPSVGGIRKVIKTGQITPGTTIAELGDQTITLAQLAALLTIIQQQQTNTGGGNIGAGDEATISLGPGLAGGGVLVGNVPIRLVAPIPAMLAEDGADGDPGPPGRIGVNGANGATGGTGPTGPAVFMSGEDGEDGWHAIPGSQGPQGVQGSQGAQGIQGSGNSTAGLMMWVPDDIVTDEEVFRGPASAQGTLTINGILDVNSTATMSGNLTFDVVANRNITFLGATPLIQATTAAAVLQISANATGAINMGVNNTQNIVINSSGAVTMSNAAGTAAQLTVNAASNVAAIILQGGSTPSNSNTIWRNSGAVQIAKMFGDGGTTIGPSTLADMTTGTINVSNGYFVNGVPVAGGANLTPAGAMHGMIPDDMSYEEEIYRSPTGAQGASSINGQLVVNGPNSAVTPALQINVINASMDGLIINGVTGTIGPDFGFALGGTLKAFFGVASKANEGVTGAAANEMFIRTQTARFLLSVDAGSTSALIVSTGGPATFSSSLSIKGPTPAVIAGTTQLGTTTTTTIISTAGGTGVVCTGFVPSTFWQINVNGVAYGVPLFAL